MKKTRRLARLSTVAFTLCIFAIEARADSFLPFPNADQLGGPVFIQNSAGLAVVSEAGGVGRTESFFSDLPDGSLPGNRVVNILGNFQAFDPEGNPTSFQIVGVEVTVGGMTFTPSFGSFDFAGRSSLTFVDSLDFDTVTFSSGDATFAFTFSADPSLAYSYSLLTTGLSAGSFISYDDVETGIVPEPATFILLGAGLAGVAAGVRRRRKGGKSGDT